MARALTDQETHAFEGIRNCGNIALLNATYIGMESAVIVAVNEDPENPGMMLMTPLAVLVSEDMLDDFNFTEP